MFFSRLTPTTQLVLAVIVLGLAPVVVTELATHGFGRTSAFLHRWQTLIAGSFAVIAAYLTISEMRHGRTQNETRWAEQTRTQKQLATIKARTTIFNTLDRRMMELLKLQESIRGMLVPQDFEIKVLFDLNSAMADLAIDLGRPEISEAFKITGVSPNPIKKRSASLMNKIESITLQYEPIAGRIADESDPDQIDSIYETPIWLNWRVYFNEFRQALNEFLNDLSELIDNASLQEN